MLLDGQKLHRGADSSNLRPLGAIGVQVHVGGPMKVEYRGIR